MMKTSQKVMFNQDDLKQVLEPLIRRVVREELLRVTQQQQPDIFFLHSDMPLYADMEEIAQRKVADTIELISHKEVWGE
ncbi:MAG: hypothetical protein U9Q58_03505 [Pseudomonadota bacterium]|nr:hypothetical protein [Pseudomonadota bacterium]